MSTIDSFRGQYRFLSNFYPAIVEFEGMIYPSAEHAYQAAKTTDSNMRKAIARARTPGTAKSMGRSMPMRPDWDEVKLKVMTQVVHNKFNSNPEMGEKLLQTGETELIEGNHWNDTYWGQCNGTGENHLGKILMSTRKQLQRKLTNAKQR